MYSLVKAASQNAEIALAARNDRKNSYLMHIGLSLLFFAL
jgi:hypothetical protein